MWATLIATVTAAAVCLSLISLATQLQKDGVINPPYVEHTVQAPKAG